MELNKVLDRIRALVAKAESTDNAAEAATYQAKADELMQKYLIEEWQLKGKAQTGFKPTRIRVDIGAGNSPLLSETAALASIIADFCKCSSVWMSNSGWKSAGRQEYCWVYGYESDLAYFELLYTTIYLHMSGAIFPKPNPNLTAGANVRDLRKAGLNWVQVAEAFGWHLTDTDPKHTEFTNGDGEKALWNKVVNPLKAAYKKHCALTGEAPVSLGRGGAGNLSFRISAARGYIARISQRLREVAGQRGTGAELVLADKRGNIAAMVADDFPEMSEAESRKFRLNMDAYERGVRHANTADLHPGRAAESGGSAPAIGA